MPKKKYFIGVDLARNGHDSTFYLMPFNDFYLNLNLLFDKMQYLEINEKLPWLEQRVSIVHLSEIHKQELLKELCATWRKPKENNNNISCELNKLVKSEIEQ